MCNRYLVRVRHPEEYGIDLELLADDTTEAATMALEQCPADTFIERIVPCEIDALEADGTPTTAGILSRERMARNGERTRSDDRPERAGSGTGRPQDGDRVAEDRRDRQAEPALPR
jgi:hypothetical protein